MWWLSILDLTKAAGTRFHGIFMTGRFDPDGEESLDYKESFARGVEALRAAGGLPDHAEVCGDFLCEKNTARTPPVPEDLFGRLLTKDEAMPAYDILRRDEYIVLYTKTARFCCEKTGEIVP